MVTTDHTDPGLPAVRHSPRRQVYFGLKDWGVLVGLVSVVVTAAMFVMGLMYYGKLDGVALRNDFDHHSTENAKIDSKQDAEIMALDETDETVREALHRIELRQERLAPRHRVDMLPASLRTPKE